MIQSVLLTPSQLLYPLNLNCVTKILVCSEANIYMVNQCVNKL